MPAESSASSRPQEPPTTSEVTKVFSQMLWKIQELEATLADFDPQAHGDLFEQRLYEYHKLLYDTREMVKQRPRPGGADDPSDHLKNTLEGRAVPEGLVRALDHGINPDEFMRETFRASKRDNQISKGKCEGLQALAAALLEEAGKVCPEEAEEYRRIISKG